MKLLAILFALYTLSLPLIPCSDGEECDDHATIALIQSSDSQQDHQHETDNCNPFCQCTCCPQNSSLAANFIKEDPGFGNADNSHQSAYSNPLLSSDFFGRIWQPPRIS